MTIPRKFQAYQFKKSLKKTTKFQAYQFKKSLKKTTK